VAAVLDTTLEPMLARLARELPADGYLYEPKWDGFRCLVFRSDGEIDLRSRNRRPLARYVPELVEALAVRPERRFVLDGEIVVASKGRFDFAALLARLHLAASRVERLRRETPAFLVAFDLLALGGDDLRDLPFGERRRLLADLLPSTRPPASPDGRSPVTASVPHAGSSGTRAAGSTASSRSTATCATSQAGGRW
jgi:ATP-dependent DNA ligase